MHNQPFNPFIEPRRPRWHDVDARPTRRVALLAVVLCLPIPLIGARVAWVQTVLPDDVIAIWESTETTTATIAARDGRIIAGDGVVLAYDQPRFDLAVQYRWIESPPDEDWLRRQALSQLDRYGRRDRERVAAAVAAVRKTRQQMWSDLSTLTGVSPRELAHRAREVQQRVERIKEAVQRRRDERTSQRRLEALDLSGGWLGLWETLRTELTSAPERLTDDPLVLAEELQAHVLVEGISPEAVGAIHSHPSRFPGVDVRQFADRVYPEGRLAAHLIGIRESLEAAEFAGGAKDRIGRTGIERAYNRQLEGQDGATATVRDRRGQVLEVRVERPVVDGPDLILTVDSRLQRAAEELLQRVLDGERFGGERGPEGERASNPVPVGGVIVVLDVWTGDVLVAADAPAISQGVLQHPSETQWREILEDPRRPLFPRVTHMAIAPGSVFKVLTAVAALESGRIDPAAEFFCRGYLDDPGSHRCLIYRHHGVGHGEVTVTDALCESCNVYFFDAARRLGPEMIADWAWRFGFGRPTGIDLPGEASGSVPSPQSSEPAAPWRAATTLQLGIGQASLTVTPLQIARMMAALANGGYVVTPRIVRQVRGARSLPGGPEGGGPVDVPAFSASAVHRIEGISDETLAIVREGLVQAVEHPRGTGRNARVPGVKVAGKTGTAEVAGDRPDHAWFAGYVPADAPRYAFAIALEHGGSGGDAAAPIARELVFAMKELGVIAASGR